MSRIAELVIGSFIVLSFGCAKKEAATPAASGAEIVSTEQKETAAAEIQDKPIEKIIQAAKQPLRNPFLTEEEEREAVDLGNAISIDYLALSAIIYSTFNKSKAIINGQVLKIGDYVDNKEIIKIQPEAVILKNAQAQYIVKLKTGSGR